jgi:hypothetical protein
METTNYLLILTLILLYTVLPVLVYTKQAVGLYLKVSNILKR